MQAPSSGGSRTTSECPPPTRPVHARVASTERALPRAPGLGGGAMTQPRVMTEALGGPALSQAVAAGHAPLEWYERCPSTAGEWVGRAAAIRAERRSEDWLEPLLPALAPSGRAAERLDASRGGKGIVVTTGQQPGLFGGPIYTWSKALSALALADAMQAATGIPVAPIFWAATDDSDFAEASWTMVARAGGVDELRMEGDATGVSMAQVPLGDQTHLLERLEQASGSAAFRDPLTVARRAYDPGATVGSAYLALLRGLLEPLGISVLDAAHTAVRAAAAPVLRRALDQASAVESAVAERGRALTAAGHSPQVASVAGLSLVFASEGGRRERIRIADAPSAAARSNDTLSPNVLLRPVVERAILPTAAYVAGPAELAYFAQTGAVAAALGLAAPLAVPRWSCTILEPHVERIMARLGLTAEDLVDPHAAESGLARAALPGDVSSALTRMRNAIDESLDTLRREMAGLVPSAVVDGSGRSLEHRIARLERRLVAAVKRRSADMLRDVATARGSLRPAGKRQERALNFLPLLARYGPSLLQDMLRQAGAHARSLVERHPETGRDVSESARAAGRV